MKRSEFLRLMAGGLMGLGASQTFLRGQPVTPNGPEKGEYQISPHFASHGPGFGNRIAVTFDDWPTPGVTEVVLKELAARNLHATFFMIGSRVDQYPSLAKEVADAGHEIGNHSYTHPALSTLPPDRVDSELQKTQDAIIKATGKTPVWFRPPYGAFRKDQGYIPESKNLGVVYWSVDPRDWSQPGVSAIISRIVAATVPGSIVLMHDLHPQTAQALGSVLDQLEEKDFSFTHVSGFLGAPYGTYFAANKTAASKA